MKKIILTIILSFIFTVPSTHAMAPVPEAEKLYNQAEDYYKNKDLNSAESTLKEAINLEPDNAVYRYILAQIQCKKSNYLDAKDNLEIVSHSRVSQEKDETYNKKLKAYKKKIKNLQTNMSKEGSNRYAIFEKNKNSPQRLKVAVTAFQAFKLNPSLRYRDKLKTLEEVTSIYENALQKSISGEGQWQQGPMLQLAFLYEIANKKDRAAEVYMRALDYVTDQNEEFVITHRFDYLNRSNKEKLLDTIEAGEFTFDDVKDMMSDDDKKAFDNISDSDKQKFKDMLASAQDRLGDASSDEDRNKILEDIKNEVLAKQKSGEIKIDKDLEKKLNRKLKDEVGEDAKTIDEYMKENNF